MACDPVRGAQLINVFHKGTLYQDLATYYRERPTISTIYPRKVVRLDPESLPQVRSQRRLFDELLRCAILHRERKQQDS